MANTSINYLNVLNNAFFYPSHRLARYITNQKNPNYAHHFIPNLVGRGLSLAQAISSAVALPLNMLATLFYMTFVSDEASWYSCTAMAVKHAMAIPLGFLVAIMPPASIKEGLKLMTEMVNYSPKK